MIIGISGKIGSGKDTVRKMLQGLDVGFRDEVIIDTITSPDGDNWLTESDFEIKRFADKLKDTVCLWLGCTREQLEDRKFKEKPLGEEWNKWVIKDALSIVKVCTSKEEAEKWVEDHEVFPHWEIEKVVMTPRKLMQLLGTEAGRKIIHPDIWVNATMAEYKVENWHPNTTKITGSEPCEHEPKWIIPDTRFPNEADAIKQRDGIMIRVNRDFSLRFPDIYHKYKEAKADSAARAGSLYSWLQDNHPYLYEKLVHSSEVSLDSYQDWDFTITNNRSLQDLLNKVKSIYEQL